MDQSFVTSFVLLLQDKTKDSQKDFLSISDSEQLQRSPNQLKCCLKKKHCSSNLSFLLHQNITSIAIFSKTIHVLKLQRCILLTGISALQMSSEAKKNKVCI